MCNPTREFLCPKCDFVAFSRNSLAGHLSGHARGGRGGRTDKDYAIEFGGYLASAAEHFQDVMQAELAGDHDQDAVGDAWRGLDSAIYEFRKRAGMLK
jgi:hypothetical protein